METLACTEIDGAKMLDSCRCRWFTSSFELDRRKRAKRRMPALAVAEDFEIFEDRRLAHRPREQRTHRGSQQLDQAGQARQARCLRVHLLPELPDPLTALRREAQLGTARNHQTPLKSEEPLIEPPGFPGRFKSPRPAHVHPRVRWSGPS
jgi:hypothetical protein